MADDAAVIDPVAAPEGTRSQMIAVVSPRGGLGKTSVATNLAVGLAKLAPMSVVLVDADMQFGDVSTVLALDPARTLPDMVGDLAPRDSMVLKTFFTAHPSGFYAVCGSESPADCDSVTGEQFSHLVQQLSGKGLATPAAPRRKRSPGVICPGLLSYLFPASDR